MYFIHNHDKHGAPLKEYYEELHRRWRLWWDSLTKEEKEKHMEPMWEGREEWWDGLTKEEKEKHMEPMAWLSLTPSSTALLVESDVSSR